MKPTNIHTFTAAVLLGGYLIVKAAANDEVTLATASTDLLIGTTDQFGAAAAGAVGIPLGGISEVKLGGNVAMGEPITADANSKGVKCVAAAGEQRRYIGFALKGGVDGDVIPYVVVPGVIYEPAGA